MANKTKATPQKQEAREKGPETPDAPLPLLDLSDAAFTEMIKQAKRRGYITPAVSELRLRRQNGKWCSWPNYPSTKSKSVVATGKISAISLPWLPTSKSWGCCTQSS
jgi:hypothetical protein